MHDADALQSDHVVPEVLAHPTDLPVQPLRQDDAELTRPGLLDLAPARDGPENGHAPGHVLDEGPSDGPVHGDVVLLFMVVAGPQDLVDDVPVTGQENEPLTRLVEATHRENALLVADGVDDVVPFPLPVRGADDAHRLVIGDVDMILLLCRLADGLPVHLDRIARHHLRAQLRDGSVERNAPLLEQLVRRPAGTMPHLAQVLVDADSRRPLAHAAKVVRNPVSIVCKRAAACGQSDLIRRVRVPSSSSRR